GATVAATALTADHPKQAAAPTAMTAGAPPLALDLGVRTDPEATALRRATQLYDKGQRTQALPIFRRYRSLEARVGAALADWPDGLAALLALGKAYPKSPVVQLHVGLARYWTGHRAEARAAWTAAAGAGPDTGYGVRAEDLLHPEMPPGL